MTRLGALAATLLLLTPAPAPASAQAAEEEAARVALIARIKPSVVQVKTVAPPAAAKEAKKRDGDMGVDDFLATLRGRLGVPRPQEGSGFVVDSARGLIMTAAHIVARNNGVRIVLADGSEREAAVVAAHDEAGIALLRVPGGLPPALELASAEPKAGERALLLGWMIPLKSVLAFETIVTGPAPGAADKNPDAPSLIDYVALDVAIPNGGFGGGPVVDQDGKVIGMVSAIYGRDYGPGTLTLIIPAAQIAPRLATLSAGVR